MSDPTEPAEHPASRNYLFIGAMALLVVAAVMFVRGSGSLPAALLPTVVAAAGLVFRWTVLPVFALVLLNYFIVAPYGWPTGGFQSDVYGSAFRLLDLVLVAACLVYFACQYRLLSLTKRAMPNDNPTAPATDKPRLRPESLVGADEYRRLFTTLGACVFAGQVLWIVIASTRVGFETPQPFGLRPDAFVSSSVGRERGDGAGDRFLMLVGVFAALALVSGIVFWYWRLMRLSRAEAAMMLLDTGWRENRRELNRQEKWRAWGVRKARRASGIVEDAPPPKGSNVWGCFQLVLFAILGPIALFLLIRLAWPIFVP